MTMFPANENEKERVKREKPVTAHFVDLPKIYVFDAARGTGVEVSNECRR